MVESRDSDFRFGGILAQMSLKLSCTDANIAMTRSTTDHWLGVGVVCVTRRRSERHAEKVPESKHLLVVDMLLTTRRES